MYTPPKILRFESTLLSVSDMTNSVKEFTFSVPENFIFVPGQFATMLFEKDGKKYRRPYSIASSPHEAIEKKRIRLCIKKVEGGPGTTLLWSKNTGDKLNFMAPLGVFVLKEEHKNGPLTFVSTGTGVAPFISMIVDLLENNFSHNITLICGYRHVELYDELLLTLTKKHNNFTYKPILSQPLKESYTGNKGRVQQLVVDTLHTNPEIKKSNFYVCGLYEMIEQTCRTLISSGISREQIHFERYD